MKEELSKRIARDLEKSGFASEMKAIRVFLDRGWRCSGGASYFDRDQKQTRNIDFSAYRPIIWKHKSPRIDCFFHIVAEVKKSEKPWIIFKSPQRKPLDAWNNLVFYDNLPLSGDKMVDELSKGSLLVKCGWQGYGLHESFKNPNQPSSWYAAYVAACKAAEDVLEADSWDVDRNAWDPSRSVYLLFVKPLVILDGLLFGAEIVSDGSLCVEQIASAPMNCEYRTANYTRRSYAVDIVTLGSVEAYLDMTESRQSDIMAGMARMVQTALAT